MMHDAGFVSLDFDFYFEPENGINTPEEFSAELLAWAKREGRDLTILQEGMEPSIQLDGETYACRLADPGVASQKNPLWKAVCKQGVTYSFGKFLGYKWVYLYRQ